MPVPEPKNDSRRWVLIGLVIGIVVGGVIGFGVGSGATPRCEGVSVQLPNGVISLAGTGQHGYLYFYNTTGLYEVHWDC